MWLNAGKLLSIVYRPTAKGNLFLMIWHPATEATRAERNNMEWRIRESGHGGFIAEKGIEIKGGIEAGYKPGCYMPALIVYESARFGTKREAEHYIKNS